MILTTDSIGLLRKMACSNLCVVQEEPDRAPSTLKPEGIVTLTELRLNYFLGRIKLTWFKKGCFNLNLMGANELICKVIKIILWVNLNRKLFFFIRSPLPARCEDLHENKGNGVTMAQMYQTKSNY